jgi:F-type H+-transporting ATPase subunit delta
MSSITTLARPYAKAAFELAQTDNSLAQWDDMLSLAGVLASDEAMFGLFDSPHVTSAQAVQVMTEAAGDAFNDRFRDFLSVLASNGRLPLLSEVARLFTELRAEAEKRLSVRVVSAIALDEDQAERMKAALARRFEREIELVSEIDSSVIGGAVVYAGDQVIDGSLRGRLQQLSNNLSN